MEYLRLGDLARFRNSDGPFHPTTAGLIVRQVLEGIVFMHEISFAHRDLKPGVSEFLSVINQVTYRNSEHSGSVHKPMESQNCRLWNQQTMPRRNAAANTDRYSCLYGARAKRSL